MFYGEAINLPCLLYACVVINGAIMKRMSGKSIGHNAAMLLLSFIYNSASSDGNAVRIAERQVAERVILLPSSPSLQVKLSLAFLLEITSAASIFTLSCSQPKYMAISVDAARAHRFTESMTSDTFTVAWLSGS